MKIAIKRVQRQVVLGYAEREQFGAKLKKFMTNIKTLAALLMAGAAFTACSSDDDIIDEQPVNPAGKYTMTVNASKGGAETRALELDSKTLKVKWASTDQVSVFPEAWSTDLTLTPIGTLTAAASDDGSTTLTGDVTTTGLNTGDKVQMLFPRATWDYTGQTGILLSDANSIEKKYDYALATPTITVDGDNITADASFESQQAIVKFILKDAGGNAIDASSLTIAAASGKLVQSRGMKKTYTDPAGYEDVSGLSGYYVYVETSAPATTDYMRVVSKKGDDWIWLDLDDTYGSGGCKVVSGAYVYRFKTSETITTIDQLSFQQKGVGDLIDFRSTNSWGEDTPIAFTNGMYLRQNASKKVDEVTPVEGDPVMGSTYGSLNVTSTPAASELTVALRNEQGAADTYLLTAIVGGTTYFFEKSGANFQNGKYYEITVKMTQAASMTDLSTKTSDYTVSDGEVLTGKMGANDAHLVIPDGYTVTLLNTEIDYTGWSHAIQCQGSATIILKGTNVLKSSSSGGIQNGGTGTLTLKGTGTLNVKASGAAIGNSDWSGTGDIVIQGGTYNLQGQVGIGAAINGYSCGDITISGGTINVTNVESAGIGVAFGATCGNILISGGTVVATGSGYDYSPGIGASMNGTCGTITISGGTVTASGGSAEAAGIGCGDDGQCGAITISGGTVTAIAGTGGNENARPAIGKKASSGTLPSVTITTGITSLTMINSNSFITEIGSDFIYAEAVYANTDNIKNKLSLSVSGFLIMEMPAHGFTTSYDSTTKTWTFTK